MIDLNALVLAGLIYLKDKEQEKNKMKEFDKKDVFNITNAEDANEYVGKEGYFADCLYKDLNMWKKGILDEIVKDATSFPFVKLNTQDGISITVRLFLPADKVKDVEEPKKWRAFRTFEEFILVLGHSSFIMGSVSADKVKEIEEKKYRSFKNLNEFKECISKDTLTCLDHGIEIIDTSKGSQYRLMILGTFTNGIILPLYGALTFEQLFEKFKININGNWQPFGVEDKE